MTVLIVEDEALIAMDLQVALEDIGLEVILAYDLAQARLSARSTSIHTAVLDLNLPDGSTFPLAEELYAAGTRIVFISGGDIDEQSLAKLDAQHFQKPFDVDAVGGLILKISEAS